MTKKIIALDLDGTTLNHNDKITERTVATIRKAQEAGNQVILTTGRPYRISRQYYQQLGLKTPMINFNGGLIHLPEHHWEYEQEYKIPKDLVFDIAAVSDRYPITMMAVESKNQYLADRSLEIGLQFFPPIVSPTQYLNHTNLTTDPTSLTVFTDQQTQSTLRDMVTKKYHDIEVNTWGGNTAALEVLHNGVHKASALQYLANVMGFKTEDIIAFGDELNDIEMLSSVGLGVAMANARDEIKLAAKDVTEKSNDEDGMADYLEKVLDL